MPKPMDRSHSLVSMTLNLALFLLNVGMVAIQSRIFLQWHQFHKQKPLLKWERRCQWTAFILWIGSTLLATLCLRLTILNWSYL